GFADLLDEDAVAALVSYIYAPLPAVPGWSIAEMESTRIVHAQPPALQLPVFDADPLNLFVVVEAGDHHVTILDGDRFEPIHRFQSRFALHGGPKFTPDGRFVFFVSRDGWVTKFDLWSLTVLAEIRAGLNTRNIALSRDGKHVAVANHLPNSLVLLDADDLSVTEVLDVEDERGR